MVVLTDSPVVLHAVVIVVMTDVLSLVSTVEGDVIDSVTDDSVAMALVSLEVVAEELLVADDWPVDVVAMGADPVEVPDVAEGGRVA